MIVLVKLELFNYMAIFFRRWSRGLDQSDQPDVSIEIREALFLDCITVVFFCEHERRSQYSNERALRVWEVRALRTRGLHAYAIRTCNAGALYMTWRLLYFLDGWLRSQKYAYQRKCFFDRALGVGRKRSEKKMKFENDFRFHLNRIFFSIYHSLLSVSAL